MIYDVFAFQFSDSLRESADPQLVACLKSGDPIVGSEVGQETGVLGHSLAHVSFAVENLVDALSGNLEALCRLPGAEETGSPNYCSPPFFGRF